MALLKRTETGPLGTTTEEWDADPVKLVGLGMAIGISKGLYEWVSSRFSRKLPA